MGTTDRKQEILKVLQNSGTLQNASDQLGISRQRVQQVAKEFGISMTARRHEAIMEVLTDEVIAKHTTLQSLARDLGLYPHFVRNHLKLAGKFGKFTGEEWKAANLPIHGSTARYRRGCRCAPCTRANSDLCLFNQRKRKGKLLTAPVAHGPNKGHTPVITVFAPKEGNT